MSVVCMFGLKDLGDPNSDLMGDSIFKIFTKVFRSDGTHRKYKDMKGHTSSHTRLWKFLQHQVLEILSPEENLIL